MRMPSPTAHANAIPPTRTLLSGQAAGVTLRPETGCAHAGEVLETPVGDNARREPEQTRVHLTSPIGGVSTTATAGFPRRSARRPPTRKPGHATARHRKRCQTPSG